MAQLSELELLKASRNPLRVIDDLYKEALEGIPLKDEYIGLLKWYGMYPHINKDGLEDKKYFMKRIKLVDARMNLEQLRVMGEIGQKYAQGLVDFTTRQNVQFHYIEIKDTPAIFDLLNSVNLTSRMASGDGPRPIMTCPVTGIDEGEIYDVQNLLKEVDAYFDKNDDRFLLLLKCERTIRPQHYHGENRGSKRIVLPAYPLNTFETYKKCIGCLDRYGILDH